MGIGMFTGGYDLGFDPWPFEVGILTLTAWEV